MKHRLFIATLALIFILGACSQGDVEAGDPEPTVAVYIPIVKNDPPPTALPPTPTQTPTPAPQISCPGIDGQGLPGVNFSSYQTLNTLVITFNNLAPEVQFVGVMGYNLESNGSLSNGTPEMLPASSGILVLYRKGVNRCYYPSLFGSGGSQDKLAQSTQGLLHLGN